MSVNIVKPNFEGEEDPQGEDESNEEEIKQNQLNHIKQTHYLRHNPNTEMLTMYETDDLRGSRYTKFKVCDLWFIQRMFRVPEEEIKKTCEVYRDMDVAYFEQEIKFYPSLAFYDEPIVYMTQLGVYKCIENLTWAIYTPYANRPANRQRRTERFIDKVKILYHLLEHRLRVLFDMKNNPAILDTVEFIVKYGETGCSVNMQFAQIVGAYMDQLFLTIYDSPPLIGNILVFDFDDDEITKLYDHYLGKMEYTEVLSLYYAFYAESIVTPADVCVNSIKFVTPTDRSTLILHNKNDVVYAEIMESKSQQEMLKIPIFIDFVFVSAYSHCYNTPLEYKRNKLLDVYITNEHTYGRLADLIYDNYYEKIFEKIDLAQKDVDLFNPKFNDEEEKNLPYLYFPE